MCTVNSVYFLPYVSSLRQTYLCITFLIRVDKWSCSWPISWSKKCPLAFVKMPTPSCCRTAVPIFKSSIFSVLIPFSLLMTSFEYNLCCLYNSQYGRSWEYESTLLFLCSKFCITWIRFNSQGHRIIRVQEQLISTFF